MKLTIAEYTGATPTVYNSMGLPGKHDSWNAAGTPMTAQTTVVENHDWKATVTFNEKSTGADGEGCKFAANGTWDVNWGSETFPYGVATRAVRMFAMVRVLTLFTSTTSLVSILS